MPAALAIDEQAALALHEGGKSTREIATILGVKDHSTIARRLKHLTPRKSTEIFRALRADILTEKQRKLLMSSHDATPKEQRDIATAFGIYLDKERLERGQSTSNQAIQHGCTEELAGLIEAVTGKRPG